MILKIQKSIATSDTFVHYLIYNETRSIQFETDDKDDDFGRLFEKDIYKIFVDVCDSGNIKIIGEQNW